MIHRKIFILTLFPEMFESFSTAGIIGKALSGERSDSVDIKLELVQIRDYAQTKYKSVDDYPFGGGAGMVMRADVLARALEGAVFKGESKDKFHIIFPAPRGAVFNNSMAKSIAENYLGECATKEKSLVFICGRYEGVDERFLTQYVNEFISLGDFILSGGELATMTILDSSLRFVRGILGNKNSAQTESFQNGLLEYPQYTKPRVFENLEVPEVMLSGHHKNIEQYQEEESLRLTKKYRPDLWSEYHEK